MKHSALITLGLALALAAGCKAPIPDRTEIEADAAWNASEWRDDYGDVWRVRTNSRRVSATEVTPDSGVTLRGTIASGALAFSLLDKGGQEIGKGEAKIADATHALFHITDAAGKETSHGLWHFDHMSSGAAPTPAPTPITLPSVSASPSGPSPAVSAPVPVNPTPSPDDTATLPPETPQPSLTPTQSPATPAKPGDPLDLRPH